MLAVALVTWLVAPLVGSYKLSMKHDSILQFQKMASDTDHVIINALLLSIIVLHDFLIVIITWRLFVRRDNPASC